MYTGYFVLFETISGIARRFYLSRCRKVYLYKMEYGRYRAPIQPFRHLHRQHPEHISCPILLPLSCIVSHYIVALGTRFLVLQRCYCPSDLSAITIISSHDLSRYPLKPKRLCEREVSRLSLPGEILCNPTRRRTQCDERHDLGTWQAEERNSTLSV